MRHRVWQWLRRFGWAGFAVAGFVASLALGLIGWTIYGLGFWEALYRTIRLFAMDGEADGEVNGFLWAARFLAPMATVSGIIAVVFRVLYDGWSRWWAIHSRDHVVVLGGGPEAARIAVGFRKNGAVVCVGAVTPEEQIELRASRVRWMVAASEEQLKRILRRCTKVIITAPDDQEASSLTSKVQQWCKGQEPDPVVVTLVASRDVAVDWRHRGNDRVLCRSEQVARSVLRTCPPTDERGVCPPPVVLGDGRLAAELVARIFEGWQQPGESITVRSGGPQAARAHFVARGLGFSDSQASLALKYDDGPQGLGTLIWHDLPAGTHLAARLTREALSDWNASWLAFGKHSQYETAPARVYVAFYDDAVTLPVANAVKRSLGDDVMVVAVPKDDGLARHLRAAGVVCHPQEVMLCTPEELGRTTASEVAEELVAELGRWPDDAPSLFGRITRDADGLAVQKMQSEAVRAGVDVLAGHICEVARLVGFGITAAPLPMARVTVLTPTELADIAAALETRIPSSPEEVSLWERRTRLLELAGRLPALLNGAGRTLVRESGFQPDRIPPERLDELAQLAHLGFQKVARQTGNATGSEYATMAYRRLPPLVRSSNVAQVLDIPVKLALLGLTLAPRPEPERAVGVLAEYEFTAEDVELLAYQEHRRWAHFQMRNGRSSHNWNKPWDVLPDNVREYDRQVVRLIPLLLREVGLIMVEDVGRRAGLPDAPVLRPAEGTFWRIGEVHAERLAEPRSWHTESGDALRGEAGDWWVWSDDPKNRDGRSVKPEAFARTYRLIEGDSYERIGSVHARQVLARERVETDEGTAHAQPHDWVLTEGDATWPVSEKGFEKLYDSAPKAGRA
ncbi:hypothetical protein SAMN02745244_02897 [Tessaracoccus bendigoensis DSM 12906]|uniref:RyR domain-containing protein n=1 Tax=Tessaracoccus bendigoensis DSM 12906 TaxID=1123357 RepID=A0A1M6KRI4_9ACTN|nr:NAD(P)-dependent oxidoreductase [Tessaracoccus bendigoensis]SHJ61549.1 hypothetical protein SAMN02745244_02897 [Tessaracoccus bendigoensis DSM 12906]